jgi:hypothetical protein
MRPLDETARAFMESRILLAAIELGLFDRVLAEPADAETLAAKLGASRRGVEILANALVAMGVLVLGGGRYALSAEAEAHLQGDEGRDWLAMGHHWARLYRRWAHLPEIVRDEPVPIEQPSALEDPDANESFIRGMAAIADDRPQRVLDAVGLDGVAVFADVGGGPGLYAVEALRRRPDLVALLVDLPQTLASADAVLGRFAEGESVRRVTWRLYDEPAPAELPAIDLALVSQVIHAESPENNVELLRKIAGRLSPGGRIAVHENMLEEDRVSPIGAAIFSVNMLAMTDEGRSYTGTEIAAMADEAGLTTTGTVRLDERSAVVLLERDRS